MSRSRERLRQSLLQHQAQYKAQLDLLATSGSGDLSELCNETYASLPACQRAIRADTTARRKQIFPVSQCGQIIPGKFVTANDAAEEVQRPKDQPEAIIVPPHLTFRYANGFYRNRLKPKLICSKNGNMRHSAQTSPKS